MVKSQVPEALGQMQEVSVSTLLICGKCINPNTFRGKYEGEPKGAMRPTAGDEQGRVLNPPLLLEAKRGACHPLIEKLHPRIDTDHPRFV
ncbi:hypothetical protein AUK22_07770 [bacterium CG2_30_54_10]|nr:MAG: hypothetical protein AUK22_07770 [bacterium CG2_30_54_10]